MEAAVVIVLPLLQTERSYTRRRVVSSELSCSNNNSSGTLGYVMSELEDDETPSHVVKAAKMLSYVMDKDKNKAPELRKVIAAVVASNKEKYNEAFLEKQNEEYCTWILNPEKWGGTSSLLLKYGLSTECRRPMAVNVSC